MVWRHREQRERRRTAPGRCPRRLRPRVRRDHLARADFMHVWSFEILRFDFLVLNRGLWFASLEGLGGWVIGCLDVCSIPNTQTPNPNAQTTKAHALKQQTIGPKVAKMQLWGPGPQDLGFRVFGTLGFY